MGFASGVETFSNLSSYRKSEGRLVAASPEPFREKRYNLGGLRGGTAKGLDGCVPSHYYERVG